MPIRAWNFAGLRPPNFPTRRIAALAELLVKFLPDGLMQRFMEICQLEATPDRLEAALAEQMNIAATGFWLTHDDLTSGPRENIGALLGSERAKTMLINIVLPGLMAFARQENYPALATSVTEALRVITDESDNRIGRGFHKLWKLSRVDTAVLRPALRAQGLIQLHRKWCEFKLCRHCPLNVL
jgi:hypothetical protein